MGDRSPRRGSLAYWHRSRAKRLVPRVRSWPVEGAGLGAFAGYKAGMTSVMMVDDTDAATKGQEIIVPVTVLEVPPIFIYAIVGYKRTTFGIKVATQVNASGMPKQLKRAITPAKVAGDVAKLAGFDEYRVLACMQPWKATLGKKVPEVLEIGLAGTPEEQLEYAKGVLGKEVKVTDVFKPGEFIDAIGVSIGRGVQGIIKRHGVSLNPRKASQSRRHGGSIGGERQAKVMYTIPRAGQHGYHRRTDSNKRVLSVGDATISPVSSFPHYGRVKTDLLMIKGSVPGPRKRFITLRRALVAPMAVKQPNILK